MPSLRTNAWLLRGLSSLPGTLMLQGAHVSFEATGTGSAWPRQLRALERELSVPGLADALAGGKSCRLFRWPTSTVRVWVPWYYFGGGIKIAHESSVLRISFGRPVDLGGRNIGAVADQWREIQRMRAQGREWVSALRFART